MLGKSNTRAPDFLALVERTRRGHLKLYLGFAAGVGKTYRMLEEAHELRQGGVDIVLGYIETHGRADTVAQLRDLEQVARRRIEYRGVVVEELDLEAILRRRPKIAVIDEIAHTNAPGAANKKRYQDVLQLLDAGINVIGAFNIQHLESLNDLISRTAGVPVRETIPDSFLKQADQIVNLDLAVEDLLARLQAGKIYSADKVPWALAHFFQGGNLSTLRGLSLREVAASLERDAARRSRGEPLVTGRVMACLSSHSLHAASLLRRASRMAGHLRSDWFVVYVETPDQAPTRIDAESQRRLHTHLETARELGAEVVQLQGQDPVAMLLDFARAHGIGHIIIGRSQKPWWRQVLGRSVALRLVREAAGFDVHIVSFPETEERP